MPQAHNAAPYQDKNGVVHEYGVFDVNAAYDTTGKLIEVKLVEDTIDAIGDYELSGTVATGAASYKAMLWNGNLLPYSDSEIYIIEE